MQQNRQHSSHCSMDMQANSKPVNGAAQRYLAKPATFLASRGATEQPELKPHRKQQQGRHHS